MKTIIVYNSKTGFTKKYAKWIADAIKCETLTFMEAKTTNISTYDTVIFASFLYAGQISKLKWFKNQNVKNKIVFAIGAGEADSPEIKTIIENNFKGDMGNFKVFYAQGGLCYEKMSSFDKMIMSVPQMATKKKFGADSQEYKTICKSYDACSKDALTPLINYTKEITNG